MVEAFETASDETSSYVNRATGQVAEAIHGSGAFRNFKATIRRLGIEARWFAYKTLALETIARDWLAENGLLPNQALQADDQLGSAPSPVRR
jgi:hypothetical protein